MKLFIRGSALSLILLVLGFASVVLSHGHDEGEAMDMSGGMDHTGGSTVSTSSNSTDMGEPSYFRLNTEYSGLMLAHIVLMTVGWVFVLPVGVMLSIARSSFTIPVQFVFLVVNGLGVFLGTIYNANTPDLYPNNAHHKLGWILTWTVCAQVGMAMILVVMKKLRKEIPTQGFERMAFIPISQENMAEHQRFHDMDNYDNQRFSRDSGNGTERNTESLRSHSFASTSSGQLGATSPVHELDHDEVDLHKEKLAKSETAIKFLFQKLPILMTFRAQSIILIAYETINRAILLIGFVALTTGIVTYGGIFRGDRIFSGLAHFIKGGVFFWYGILTLGRWAGCFADIGWSWNIKPASQHKKIAPTAEFVESFLIFFYGITNVWLEHLASWGGAWSAQDFEHLSITIMFMGGGLCGMLIESSRLRFLFNSTIDATISQSHNSHQSNPELEPPRSSKFPLNPLPAIVILLLGSLMSSHHQVSMVSSMLHTQWGSLLASAALARGFTYLLCFISPPTSIYPGRPPTELVTAFCLMAGGVIFMSSNTDSVAALEWNGLGAMVVFTVTIGVVTGLMSWVLAVIGLKGWALRRENPQYKFQPPSAA